MRQANITRYYIMLEGTQKLKSLSNLAEISPVLTENQSPVGTLLLQNTLDTIGK